MSRFYLFYFCTFRLLHRLLRIFNKLCSAHLTRFAKRRNATMTLRTNLSTQRGYTQQATTQFTIISCLCQLPP